MTELYKIVSLQEAMAQINANQPLAFDTETISKYGVIRLAQFYQADWDSVLIVERPDPTNLVMQLAARPTMPIVMHYGSYDLSTLQRQAGVTWIPERYEDTFYLARLAYPEWDKYALDEVMTNALGTNPYADHGIYDKSEMQKSNWNAPILTTKQLTYAAIDVRYLLLTYDVVKKAESMFNYKLDIISTRRAIDFQKNGMPLDLDRSRAHYAKNLARIEEIACPINVNSYKQVRPYIGSTMSDQLGLIKLSLQGNTRAAQVNEARKLIKNNSFLNLYHDSDDGRLYGIFAPSARTGRFTCEDDNLQQQPRSLKDCFGYKLSDGRRLIYSDYSQLELRCIAAIVGERTIIELYREGKDLHNYVAEMIFGPEYTKAQRQIAKTCNFNLLYGGGVEMLQSILLIQASMLIDLEVLARIARKWKRLFPAIASWQQEGIRAFRRGELGSTPLGRQYSARMMTDYLNIENQGFGAEVAKLAMHYMYDDIVKLGAQMDSFHHDAYLLECDNDEEQYKAVAKVVGEAMKEAWIEATKAVKVPDMPMPVTVSVGCNWGDIEAGATNYIFKTAA